MNKAAPVPPRAGLRLGRLDDLSGFEIAPILPVLVLLADVTVRMTRLRRRPPRLTLLQLPELLLEAHHEVPQGVEAWLAGASVLNPR
jgi:hypothetical protein